MSEPGNQSRWYEQVIETTRRRERTAALRKKLAEARTAGKARRHAERLRRRGEGNGG